MTDSLRVSYLIVKIGTLVGLESLKMLKNLKMEIKNG